MQDLQNQTTDYLRFQIILNELKLAEQPQFRYPEFVVGVLNPNELLPILFNHGLIQRLILDKKYDMIKIFIDKLFESQEDDSIKDKILAEYSHPKLYEEDDKNKIIQRVKRRIERNYETIRENYLEYLFIIVKSFHEKDNFVNKLFHIEFSKDPDKFRENLIKIPNEEFFDKMLEIFCELFSLRFNWHRFNPNKRCFETWKLERSKVRGTCEFAEINGKFYLFLSKKFTIQGFQTVGQSQVAIPEADWVTEEHKSKTRVESVAQKIKNFDVMIDSDDQLKEVEEKPKNEVQKSIAKMEKTIKEKDEQNAQRFFDLKNELKMMREEEFLTLTAKIESLHEILNKNNDQGNSSQVGELQEKKAHLQLIVEKQKKDIEKLQEEKKELKVELQDLRGKQIEDAEELEEMKQKCTLISKTFVETVLNVIKINQGKENAKILENQAEQLKSIEDDQVIAFLVDKMFPRLIKAHGSVKKRAAGANQEEDDSDTEASRKSGERLSLKKKKY